jgi:rhodanese-related sulfurtransferase
LCGSWQIKKQDLRRDGTVSLSYKKNTPNEVIERIKRKDGVQIIDVRETQEWESGHIPNAKHIPLGELPGRLNELKKNKETIIVCRSGSRSKMACEFLSQMGFNVINMVGGMIHWPGDVKSGK